MKALPFWSCPSLEELAEQQEVSPVEDLDEISALWPEDDDPRQTYGRYFDVNVQLVGGFLMEGTINIEMVEKARHLGVCASAIAEAIRKMGGRGLKVLIFRSVSESGER